MEKKSCSSSENAGSLPGCEGCPYREKCLKRRLQNQSGTTEVDQSLKQIQQNLKNVKHKIVILSGKGGVGKSTFTAQLAITLAMYHLFDKETQNKINNNNNKSTNNNNNNSNNNTKNNNNNEDNDNNDDDKDNNKKKNNNNDNNNNENNENDKKILQIGVLDVDLCGPSIPIMLNIQNKKLRNSSIGWTPAYFQDNLGVVSIGFMLPNKDDAVIWRGPKKNGLIKQFLRDVYWGDSLDYLLVDTPPGTSDEHITVVQYLRDVGIDGAIVVTTPQDLSCTDVRREINFCLKTKIPVLGLVENMSEFVCPKCKTMTKIFEGKAGGGEALAKKFNIPFLGRIPLDYSLMKSSEDGKSIVKHFPKSPSALALMDIIQKIKV